MNSGLTSHQQRGNTETGPRFKVSSERPEKRGIDLATPGLVVQRVIHYTTAAPTNNVDLDQMSHYVASDLGMNCLPMTLLQVSREECINMYHSIVIILHLHRLSRCTIRICLKILGLQVIFFKAWSIKCRTVISQNSKFFDSHFK